MILTLFNLVLMVVLLQLVALDGLLLETMLKRTLNAGTKPFSLIDLGLGTRLFFKAPRPGDSEVTFSVFESSCNYCCL